MSMCVFTLSVESVTLDTSFMEARKRDFLTSTCLPATSKTETKELPKESQKHSERSTMHTSSGHRKWRMTPSCYPDNFCDGYYRMRLKKNKLIMKKRKKNLGAPTCIDHSKILSDSQENAHENFIDTVFGLLET